MTMKATATESEANPQKRPRKWLPVLAAGIVLALVGVSLLTTAGPSTPLEVAERYLSARDAYDVESARALIAPGAQLSDMPVIGADELEAGFEMLSIYEMSYDPFECTQGEGEQSTWVSCSYKLNTALNGPVGYPPVTGGISFEIVDGKIVQLLNQFPFGLYSPNVFLPFVGWVTAEHGEEAIDRLYRELPGGTATPRLDPESLEYTRTVLAEYKQAANVP
jgi:hypothetical protein